MENYENPLENEEITTSQAPDTAEPFDKNTRLMSPMRMVLRRFFRSKLSVIGLVLLIGLFIFCWLSPRFPKDFRSFPYFRLLYESLTRGSTTAYIRSASRMPITLSIARNILYPIINGMSATIIAA